MAEPEKDIANLVTGILRSIGDSNQVAQNARLYGMAMGALNRYYGIDPEETVAFYEGYDTGVASAEVVMKVHGITLESPANPI